MIVSCAANRIVNKSIKMGIKAESQRNKKDAGNTPNTAKGRYVKRCENVVAKKKCEPRERPIFEKANGRLFHVAVNTKNGSPPVE